MAHARSYVPQHRERTFIVGFKEPSEFTWDDFRLPRRQPTLDSVLHPEDGTEILDISEGGPYLDENGNVLSKYTLSGKLWKYLKDYRAKHEAKGNGFGYSLFDQTGIARTLSARYHKDGSEILISRGPRSNPRRLTPRECARLMGFDTPLGAKRRKKRFIIPVSDTQAYRQFGNAVVVPVVRKIAKTMEPHILDAISGKTKRSQDAA